MSKMLWWFVQMFLILLCGHHLFGESYPLWGDLQSGPHAVGFTVRFQYDYSRVFHAKYDSTGKLYTGKILVRNRAIFWLHHRDGMTAEAIASITWIDLNTKGVETAIRRMTHLIQSHIGTNH